MEGHQLVAQTHLEQTTRRQDHALTVHGIGHVNVAILVGQQTILVCHDIQRFQDRLVEFE